MSNGCFKFLMVENNVNNKVQTLKGKLNTAQKSFHNLCFENVRTILMGTINNYTENEKRKRICVKQVCAIKLLILINIALTTKSVLLLLLKTSVKMWNCFHFNPVFDKFASILDVFKTNNTSHFYRELEKTISIIMRGSKPTWPVINTHLGNN